MKTTHWIVLASLSLILVACGDDTETKTLYGTWDPILEAADTARAWSPTTENYLITVSGKCEAIEVTKMEKGDLANPDVPMADAKCFGNRDQLSFRDTIYQDLRYDLKLDATKDTLIGTMTSYEDGKPLGRPYRLKLLRI